MNEIPHRLDLWTFTRFVDKTRFVDGFLGNEKSTNWVMHCMTSIFTWRIKKFQLPRCRIFFSEILILKIGVKMNLWLITKNRAADPEIGFLTKLIFKSYGFAVAMPTAWEFIFGRSEVKIFF